MISVKVKFRPSTVDGKEGSLYYQIIYKRVPRQFVTDYKIKTAEWNIYSGNLEFSQADMPRYNYLSTVIQKIEWDKRRFQQIFNRLLSSKLNSTCKCNRILINNLFKFFVWREVSKSFTRSIIEFIFNPLNLFVGYFTKVLTLWDILPDKPVGVFIGTTFP